MATPSIKRVCIFVDGENFRFSLTDLFREPQYQFGKEDYLPDSDWARFFGFMMAHEGWELVRIYWYVTRDIDCWPRKIPFPWDRKRKLFERNNVIEKLAGQGVEGVSEANDGLKIAETELERRRKAILKRAEGWRQVQIAIERRNDQLEFRRVGSIRYDLSDRRFAREKGVDTQLTTDLITLADIYDVALIVSGDADYIPPVSAIKNRGKLVYSVSFMTKDGKKLPGGAMQLERRVDGRIELAFEDVRKNLGIKEKLPRGKN